MLSPEDERKLRYRFIKFMLRLYPANDPGVVKAMEERRKSKTQLALEGPESWETKVLGNRSLAEELEEDEFDEDEEEDEEKDDGLAGLSIRSGYKMGGDISM